MPDAPAAAAAASPPATPAVATTPPSTPSGKALAPFDARLQLAKSLAPARVAMPEADAPGGGEAEGDGETETEAEAAGAETEGAGSETAAEGNGAGDGDGASPERSEREQLDAVTKAFEAGDIDAMAKALERQGVKVSGPTRRAFRAFQHRVKKLDAREQEQNDRDRTFEDAKGRAQQEIANDSRRLSNAERELTRKYGTAYQLETAWEQEDMVAVGKALERACGGASLAEITQKLATGKTGKTPEERRIADERKALDDAKTAEQRKTQQAEDAKKTAQQREAAIGRIGEGLKEHPYLQTTDKDGQPALDQEALVEVFSAYEASWNGEKFTKTARKCADELQEKLVARAKARGLTAVAPAPAPAAGKTAKPQPGKKPVQQRTGVREPPRTQRGNGGPADLEASRAARVAQAKRMVEMQRRGVVS